MIEPIAPRFRAALRPLGALLVLAFAAACAKAEGAGQDAGGEPARTRATSSHGGSHVRTPLPSAEQIAKLPPDGGPEFNRLVFEQSPYLLQHARNPIDWYPWGPEAFEAAKQADKPVFLSVGYSTCHWCHVMERESFEDEEVAALLNRYFVCVKVDREERPDVDQVYMSVTQAMNQRGGWPMTILMTADQRPFFAGTYIPKSARFGRQGMMELIPVVADMWEKQRERLLADANRVVEYLAQVNTSAPGAPLTEAVLAIAFQQLAGRYDPERGGFSPAPKFPVPHNLRFLLRHARRADRAAATDMVVNTLRSMRHGGVWDHVGLGFHRYSTDEEWLLPHFEKMLYDQALVAMACVEAWQATGEPDLRRTAEEILAYVRRDMTSPEGGFYSAEDADSEGVEGLFYFWTTEQLTSVLGDEDGALAAEVWNASPGGNFTEEAREPGAGDAAHGHNILHMRETVGELAAKRDMEPAVLAAKLEDIRRRLFDAREARVHPLKDDKILTDWNGLMIAACATAARAFDDPAHEAMARRAADFLLATLRDEDGRLYKRYRQGDAALTGMLEDYAFAVWGLVELYETTFEVRYLAAAVELTDIMLEQFRDDEHGGFYLSPDDGETLITRAKEIYDGAIPSGNSVAALNLLRLARLTGDTAYEARADELFRAFSPQVARGPQAHTQLLMALDFAVGPSFELVIAGDPDADDTHAMLRALAERFLPNQIVHLRPGGVPEPAIARLAEYTKAQDWKDGKATAYVCQDFACQAPTTDIDEVLEALGAGDTE